MSNITYIYKDGERSCKVKEEKLLKAVEVEGFEISVDTILQLFQSFDPNRFSQTRAYMDRKVSYSRTICNSVPYPDLKDFSGYWVPEVIDPEKSITSRGAILVPLIKGEVASFDDLKKIQRHHAVLQQVNKDFHLEERFVPVKS